MDIKKVAVIGSGVMGAGIAAQIANAGIPVRLLDMPQKGFGKKNALAEEALERLSKADPAPIMHRDRLKLITPGNLDELKDIADCDWVIEVVIEKLEIKQDLYARLQEVCGSQTIFSSNTSTIPLKDLIAKASSDFKKRFMITHFFNPPRYMRLLEVIKGQETDQNCYATIQDFADRYLGKTIVECHDTPGFIGNRIGTFWIQTAFLEALDRGIPIEDADAVMGKPLGIPKTGVFALMDLVGLDLMPLIGKSMNASLPETDLYRKSYREVPFVAKLIEEGYTGRKGKGGFYRIVKSDAGKQKEAIDLKTGTYRASRKPRLACLEESARMRNFLTFPEDASRYALSVMTKVLWYAASLVPEIADTLYAVDTAMKLGYNWKYGPFELLDKLGPAWFAEHLKKEGMDVPSLLEKVGSGTFYRVEDGKLQYLGVDGVYQTVARAKGQLLLQDIKRASKPLIKNGSASLWDIGDGVVCFEFTSKMNSMDNDIMTLILKSIDLVKEQGFKAMVVHNEGTNFSVGANLGLALFAINLGLWSQMQEVVEMGQKAYMALKYAPFPVVAAPSGMALGGGCEILLHCDAVQAHAELYMGLVEVGVGLIPGWGGCKEMITRWITESKRPGGSMVAVGKVFEMIGTAKVAKSAAEAKDMLYLRPHDRITMNKDRLLADAKAYVLELAQNYAPPEPKEISLPGGVAKVAMSMAVKGFVKAGKATPYDEVVSAKLAHILSGGDIDMTDKIKEEEILALEREAFATLLHNRETLDRMEHILETGKPLRN